MRFMFIGGVMALLVVGCSDRGPTKATANFESLAAERLAEHLAEKVPEPSVVLWLHQQIPEVLSPRRKAFGPALEEAGHSLVDIPLPEEAVIIGLAGPLDKDWLGVLAREHGAQAIILCAEGASAFASKPPQDGTPPVFAYLWGEKDARVKRALQKKTLAGGVFVREGADWSKLPGDTKDEDERFGWRYVILPAPIGE